MPDPISSSTVSGDLACLDPSPEPNACVPPAPAPTVCAAPTPPSEQEANAAAELATAYLRTDGDGAPEHCFKGSLGPYTIGFCTEL
ncbi:MAG TPA: hypothetical protein VIK01_10685 [Polyangiaceae bacterium]